MTEPLDPFERRVADSLHGLRPTVTPDVVGARAVFLERRRRRERKRKLLALAASGSTALTITLIAMLLSGGGPGSPRDTVALGDGASAGAGAEPSPSPTHAAVPDPSGTYSLGGLVTSTASPVSTTPYDAPPRDEATSAAQASGQPAYGNGSASAAPGQTLQPSPSPTTTSACSTAHEVNPSESTGCYVIHVGETFRVSYDESYWSDPETSDESVLKTGARSHVQCVRAPCYGTMQDYKGNGVGTATLSAHGDPCKTTPPDQPMCGAPVQLWEIQVHVIA